MSMIGTLKDLLKLGYPVPDSNGALQAQVALRTGALQTLLSVNDAGDGEIAVATDQDAFVIYQGDPSVGVPYFPNLEVSLFVRSGVVIAGTRAETIIPLDNYSAVSGTGAPHVADSGYIDVPSTFPDKEYLVEYSFRQFFIFGAEAGETCELKVRACGGFSSATKYVVSDNLPASGEVGPFRWGPIVVRDNGLPLGGNPFGLEIWNSSYTTDIIIQFEDLYLRAFSMGDVPT